MIITVLSLLYDTFITTNYIIYYLFCFLNWLLPFLTYVALVLSFSYLLTRLPNAHNKYVEAIFGVNPGSADFVHSIATKMKCIAHRGASLDVPENTMASFKYCVDNLCKFVEFDIRMTLDDECVVIHDSNMSRLSGGVSTCEVAATTWSDLKNVDISRSHPDWKKFGPQQLCLFEDAVVYLLENKVKMIIDLKGDSQQLIACVLQAYKKYPKLYYSAVVTAFNPMLLYKLRRRDPNIVGAISYRPHCFYSASYDAENGPGEPRYTSPLANLCCSILDAMHSMFWSNSVHWTGASCVLIHKDIVSPSEIHYWLKCNVIPLGWSVNRPLEKTYWRSVLCVPYLTSTLIGETDQIIQDKNHINGITDTNQTDLNNDLVFNSILY